MTDDRWLYRIDDYLDEDLSDADREELERHIESCDACRDEVASYRRLRRLALAAPTVPVPDDLGFRIRRRREGVRPARRPRAGLLRLLPLAAGAAAAAVLLLLVRPGVSPPGPGPDVRVAKAAPEGGARLEQTLSDWLLLAENSRGDDARVLAAEARDLELLPRVRLALTDARGERRRWLRASEDLLVQLQNGPGAVALSDEARLVAEVTP